MINRLGSLQEELKEDPALNAKVLRPLMSTSRAPQTLLSSRITCSKLLRLIILIQADIIVLKTDTFDFKEMVTKMFQAFKGASSSTPSRSALPTAAISEVHSPIGGRICSYPEVTPSSKAIHITKAGGSSFTTPRDDKGKGIATESHPSPPKLVKASREICQDPDAPILINYMIDGKMVQLIDE
ncbi:hypothetical protein Tco_0242385 [Tanacetum coccineum]